LNAHHAWSAVTRRTIPAVYNSSISNLSILHPLNRSNSMRRQVILLSVTVVLLSLAVVVAAEPQPGRAKPIPSMSEIEDVVLRYFRAKPDYRPGDLITKEDVEPLLGKLKQKGLPLPDAKQILEKTPTKGDFLTQQLRTPDGRKFMRQISGYKDAYDRLDRLSRLPHGQQTIRDLIRGPDGYKMVEYMTTTTGGNELGKQLFERPAGEGFQRLDRADLQRRETPASAGEEPRRIAESREELADQADRVHDDLLFRHLREFLRIDGVESGNLVHDRHAVDDFTEYAIAEFLGLAAFVIEQRIVGDVDEELAGRAVGVGQHPRHGDGAASVFTLLSASLRTG